MHDKENKRKIIEVQIRNRINEMIAETTTGLPYLREIASKYKALPLFCDLGGCLAIRPDGEIIYISDKVGEGIKIEADLIKRNTALVQGSMRYPELASLIPPRPLTAKQCSECSGTGTHPITSTAKYKDVICKCGGTGWLP